MSFLFLRTTCFPLVEEAVAELEPFQDRADPLRELAQYLLVRQS